MRYTWLLFLTLAIKTAPAADKEALPDSLLAEIRALRLDLQNTATTIQRVQIVMYRLQAQSGLFLKATERLDMARGQCKQAQEQQKGTAAHIEHMRKQGVQNGADQKTIEQTISQLQATMEIWASQSQQCQGEQADAEAQFRLEQSKMSELENQLEQLDRVLAGNGRK